ARPSPPPRHRTTSRNSNKRRAPRRLERERAPGARMSIAPPPQSRERAQRLDAWGAMQGARASAALDELVRRAREVGRFPFAWISLYDGEREHIRAASGVPLVTLSQEPSFAS